MRDGWGWVEEVNSSSSVSLTFCFTVIFSAFLALLVNRKPARQKKGDNAKETDRNTHTQTHIRLKAHTARKASVTFCMCGPNVLVWSVCVCERDRWSVSVKKRREELSRQGCF